MGPMELSASARAALIKRIAARRMSTPFIRVTKHLKQTGEPDRSAVAYMGVDRLRYDLFEEGRLFGAVATGEQGGQLREQEYAPSYKAGENTLEHPVLEYDTPGWGHSWPLAISGKVICNFGNLSWPWPRDCEEAASFEEILAESGVLEVTDGGRACYRFTSEAGHDDFHVRREYFFDAATLDMVANIMTQTSAGKVSVRDYTQTTEHFEADPGWSWRLDAAELRKRAASGTP